MAALPTPGELIQRAAQARQAAYAPYSGYRVGAALLTADGDVFTGCNVENAAYGATVCAERVALWSAVAAGQRDFVMLAVVTENGGAPCGPCRQVMVEFAPDLDVLIADTSGLRRRLAARDLLPGFFGPEDLPQQP